MKDVGLITCLKNAVRLFAVIFLVLAGISGCASPQLTAEIKPIIKGDDSLPLMHDENMNILKSIISRNNTIEDDPSWIETAYKRFLIRNLKDVHEEDFDRYAKYLENRSVYIIVHPAYYVFFQDEKDPSGNSQDLTSNAVDRFIIETDYSAKTRLIRAQEKMLRDFLEFKSTEQKLVILVLPRDYESYDAYKFKDGKDEYMRYLNEVTNGADSVLYLYSKKPNRGLLAEKDRKRLVRFLYKIKAQSILLGGGYIGRCLEDFYKDIEQYFGEDKLFVVPEIVAISPSDITNNIASDLLKADGTVNLNRLSFNLRANTLGNQEINPQLKSLYDMRYKP